MRMVTRPLAVLAVALWAMQGLATAKETLKVQLLNMNPHVGQKFELRVVDKGTGKEAGRFSVPAIANHDFDVEIEVLDVGRSYWIDFYADLNGNGVYDTPPTDHAWRMELDNVQGDTTLTFTHNTTFTDIDWVYTATVNLSSMTPHIGQLLEFRVVDRRNGREVGRTRINPLPMPDISITLPGLRLGRSYDVDFYADLNQNGIYDGPPADHTWRLSADNVAGDVTLDFTHNTNFTEIDWVNALTLNLMNMNPHIGQQFEARVIDFYDEREVGRATLESIVVPDFSVEIPGIIPGRTYWVDFYADFNENGAYDAPPVDHVWREQFAASGDVNIDFTHNTNFTDTGWQYTFTLALTDMNPHLGQKFEVRVIDIGSRQEVGRASLEAITVPDFEISIPALVAGREYWADFYADFNQNGRYDAPPVDHVWRERFTGNNDVTVDFIHNTNFTNTGWAYNFTLALKNMNPHLGQKFEARVIDLSTMHEVGRRSLAAIQVPDFSVSFPAIQPGRTYRVDYYADFNQNGLYDAPPTDHAWRDTFTAPGDTTIEFTHNTNFTNTGWAYNFTLALKNMNPHLGQKFEARVIDLSTMHEVGRQSLEAIDVPNFEVKIPGVQPNGRYWVDFYADFNQNGLYDTPPTDHVWREQFSTPGDTTVEFTHNTSFTDTGWPYLFTLNLENMNPHLGQKFEMRVVDEASDKEVGRKSLPAILVPNFSVSVPGLVPGNSYRVDYYADLNQNGLYDTPPTDHAWRDTFTSNGDASVEFIHNTTFTDIDWVYNFTLNLKSMRPHLGQLFELRVVNQSDETEVGRTRLETILLEDFAVSIPGIRLGTEYRVDYYADFNQNGGYDAPPTDHAWRDFFSTVSGDTTLEFTHNTNFTDIQWPPSTGIVERDTDAGIPTAFDLAQNYPNPFNPRTTIRFDVPQQSRVQVQIYNNLGRLIRVLVDEEMAPGRYSAVWDGRDAFGRPMASGIYLYRMLADDFQETARMVLLK